jgi:hypothetical protein
MSAVALRINLLLEANAMQPGADEYTFGVSGTWVHMIFNITRLLMGVQY